MQVENTGIIFSINSPAGVEVRGQGQQQNSCSAAANNWEYNLKTLNYAISTSVCQLRGQTYKLLWQPAVQLENMTSEIKQRQDS